MAVEIINAMSNIIITDGGTLTSFFVAAMVLILFVGVVCNEDGKREGIKYVLEHGAKHTEKRYGDRKWFKRWKYKTEVAEA